MTTSNIVLEDTLADLQAQAYLDRIDAGVAAGPGAFAFVDSVGTDLVVFPLSEPPGPAVVANSRTAIITPPIQQNAIAAGKPVLGEFRDSDGTVIFRDTAGERRVGANPGDDYQQVATVQANAGGTGYVVGDLVTISSGTAIHSSRAARAEVLSVGGSGEVLTIGVQFAGAYAVNPTLVGSSTTGGSGTGLTVDLGLEEHRVGIAISGSTTVGLPVQISTYTISV